MCSVRGRPLFPALCSQPVAAGPARQALPFAVVVALMLSALPVAAQGPERPDGVQAAAGNAGFALAKDINAAGPARATGIAGLIAVGSALYFAGSDEANGVKRRPK
jgi:hypothetical protein